MLKTDGNMMKDRKCFNLLTNGWQRNRQIVKDLNKDIMAKEEELALFKDLQAKLDNDQHDQIYQGDYKGLPLFDDNDVAANGCGYIAAIIAADKLGADVDVHDAYTFMNQPGYEFFNTGAFSPIAVSNYLMEMGFYPESADKTNIEPNSVYITYYLWDTGTDKNWHYQCLTTDTNKSITGYNLYGNSPYFTYQAYSQDNDIAFAPGFAIYKEY